MFPREELMVTCQDDVILGLTDVQEDSNESSKAPDRERRIPPDAPDHHPIVVESTDRRAHEGLRARNDGSAEIDMCALSEPPVVGLGNSDPFEEHQSPSLYAGQNEAESTGSRLPTTASISLWTNTPAESLEGQILQASLPSSHVVEEPCGDTLQGLSPCISATAVLPTMHSTSLSPGTEAMLIKNYVYECARWFDAADTQNHFSEKTVHGMIQSLPWKAAALALSAKNLDLLQKANRAGTFSPLELYQVAVRKAIEFVSQDCRDVGGLYGCVILAVYEMMTFAYTMHTDWCRHLKGCATIFLNNHWNGSSKGVIAPCFWAYTRIGQSAQS